MENLVTTLVSSVWRDTSVFLTGHTGFKGSWLTLWLAELGARVHGFALDPASSPNLFTTARIADVVATDTRADLADLSALQSALAAAQPRVVFHLAAQPLVRASYGDPLGTFATNVMGTAQLLEAIRDVDSVKAVVIITTDKVYDNREWIYPYREVDPLGGYDPYSASKAAAEIVVASYRASFFGAQQHPAHIATARAGNVIGGGDWAEDRLIPDCLRAFGANRPVSLRYPGAVRPWQHVLEPLTAYLLLAQSLLGDDALRYTGAWNIGPDVGDDATVGAVAEEVARLWGEGARVDYPLGQQHPHEAGMLRLDSTRARAELGWRPRWKLSQALANTVNWHRAWLAGEDIGALMRRQIQEYSCAT